MLRSTAFRSRRRIIELTQALHIAHWNADMGCHRRPALDAAWPRLDHQAYSLIFFDLDGLNACNHRYGYAGVNRRVAVVWEALRAHWLRHDTLGGLWQGGDEFVIAVPHADALGLAQRLQDLFGFVGLSASRAIVVAGPDLAATVAQADAAVKAARGGARGDGRRGVLVDCRNIEREVQTMTGSYYYHTNDPDATFAYAHYSDPNFLGSSKIIYGTSAEGLQWDYDDRLWEWNYTKHKAAWQQARDEYPQPRTARMIARYLSLYFGKPVNLVAIEAGARPDTGYAWHAFGYRFLEADDATLDELRATLAARLARIEQERVSFDTA